MSKLSTNIVWKKFGVHLRGVGFAGKFEIVNGPTSKQIHYFENGKIVYIKDEKTMAKAKKTAEALNKRIIKDFLKGHHTEFID